jgi:transposase
LAKRYDLSRNLRHVWVQKYEVCAAAADTIQAYDAPIAALEQLVG